MLETPCLSTSEERVDNNNNKNYYYDYNDDDDDDDDYYYYYFCFSYKGPNIGKFARKTRAIDDKTF